MTSIHLKFLRLIFIWSSSYPVLVWYPSSSYNTFYSTAASTTGSSSSNSRIGTSISSQHRHHDRNQRSSSATKQEAAFTSSSSLSSSILPSGGLVNLGNTCYLNAQLQCAYHIPYIRELILSHTSLSSSSTTSNNHALKSLGHVFDSMKRASIKGDGDVRLDSISSVSTAVLCRTLGINVYEQQGIYIYRLC